jgi:hypothetical protein
MYWVPSRFWQLYVLKQRNLGSRFSVKMILKFGISDMV